MSEAKYYGVTKDGSHLLMDLRNGQLEIYESEESAKKETKVSVGNVIPVYISKESNQATIDNLVEALGASNICLRDWAVKGGAKNTFDLLSGNSKLIHELDLINSVTEGK